MKIDTVRIEVAIYYKEVFKKYDQLLRKVQKEIRRKFMSPVEYFKS